MWNYWLGGKDNYEIDRAAAEAVQKVYPHIVDIARHARAFLGRAVRHLVEKHGIQQFLDVGTGLPTVDNTHEIAQRVAPESRVVYVDNDPLVYVHAQALLTSDPRGACAYVQADAREPEAILAAAAETLDFTRPIALIIMGVLGTVADDTQAHQIVAEFTEALPSGSFVLIEDGTGVVHPEAAAKASENAPYTYRLRTPAQIEAFFTGAGIHLLEPGVVSVSRWRLGPEAGPWGLPDEVDAFGGVGRKP